MRIYIVQKGDTLEKIAKEHHVGIDTIMQLNSHISSAEYVVPGMKIKIPKSSIEWKQKNEIKREVKQVEETQATEEESRKVNRPLGTMDGLDEKRSELQDIRIPSRRPDSIQPEVRETFTKNEPDKEVNKEKTFSKPEHEDYRNIPFPNQYEHEKRMSQHLHHEREFERFNMNRERHMIPSYYHAPFNHFCPYCMYHWHMQMAYYGRPDPRNRRR